MERAFADWLTTGGFPEAQGLDGASRRQLLRDYVDVAMLRDVVERHGVSNVTGLRWLVRHLLGNAAAHFSVEKFYAALKSQGVAISKDTVHQLLAHLEDCFLVRMVWMESASERQRMVNPRKAYPVDPGLIAVFDRSGRANSGHALETAVLIELERRRFAVTAFYRAIQSVRERGMDLTGWLEFFTEGLATQLDEVKARGERAIRRDVLVRQHGLSDRQALALGRVLDQGRLTIQEFATLCPGVNRRTLQRNLRDMVEKGLGSCVNLRQSRDTTCDKLTTELASCPRPGSTRRRGGGTQRTPARPPARPGPSRSATASSRAGPRSPASPARACSRGCPRWPCTRPRLRIMCPSWRDTMDRRAA